MPAPGLPIRPSAPQPLGRSLPVPCLQRRATYLLSVGRDDANLFGRDTGAASLALALQQLLEVVDQHLNLSRVEERGAPGLSPVFPANPVEDDGEALGVESVGLCSACGSGLPPRPPPCCLPYFFGKLLPGTIQTPDIKLVTLAGLQLAVIEELIGDLEDGLVGPGRGRTVPRVGATWPQHPPGHCASRTAGALPSPIPAGVLRGCGEPEPGVHAQILHQAALSRAALSLPVPVPVLAPSPPVVPEQFGDKLWVVSSI